MPNITTLRTWVKNGWTIANRRAISSQIGKENFEGITSSAKIQNLADDTFEYQEAIKYLTPTELEKTLKLLIDNWQEKVCLLKSETFSKLFSKEFQPIRKSTPEGYPVTTIIEKATGKPVEVYFKKSSKSTTERYADDNPLGIGEKINVPFEEWTMYRKLPNGEEEKLGFINWTIQKDKNKFGFGFMAKETEFHKYYTGTLSKDFESKYSGIGIRLNQLKIERFLQEKLAQLEICSSGTAYPFHAKNGFKTIYNEKTFNLTIDEFTQKTSDITGLEPDIVEPIVKKYIISHDNNTITMSFKFLDEICPLSYLTKGTQRFGDIMMELPKESLEFWKNLINMQSILK